MNRKSFLGSLIALMAAPKLMKSVKDNKCEPIEVDEIKEYLKLDEYIESDPVRVSFRDLIPTKIDGSEINFVIYRTTK